MIQMLDYYGVSIIVIQSVILLSQNLNSHTLCYIYWENKINAIMIIYILKGQ
jgi:hypothetical protein